MATVAPGVSIPDPAVQQKYLEERNKRLRPDGVGQFLKLVDSTQFKHLQEDPWVDHAAMNAQSPPISDGDDWKFVILGAGYGGLLFAVRLIEAGFKAADIRLVDDAGGFGGTWYWNRYPGLMCDIESYIYMPLLEETGYMPRFKYAYGPELREQAQRIAEKWELTDKTLFRTRYHDAEWDDEVKRWRLKVTENRGPMEPRKEIHFKAQYVYASPGPLLTPQIPRLPGFDKFKGQYFHTSRWDYDITGGSDTEWTLDKLRDKRVGIIGTGATAVQAVPHLATWAKHLYVFQRTPSSVDVRDQRPTDLEEWKTKIASTKGWQRARAENFSACLLEEPVDENLVDDGWTRMPAYCGVIGTRRNGIITVEKIPEHVARLQASDIARAERVRARTKEVVEDPETAEKLKAWYPVWCKRPTFHDDYLSTFNQPNVTLVDTDGKGVEALTQEEVVVNGTVYPVDVLVLSTGFFLPGGARSPAHRAGMNVVGRNGLSMDDKWLQDGAATLHGVATHNFPNFFFPGPSQTGFAPNFTFTLDLLASHITATLWEAEHRVDRSDRLTVEVTKAAEDAWSMKTMMRAGWFAIFSGCTPGYFNGQGERDRVVDLNPEEQMKGARGAPWGEGMFSFVEELAAWRSEGSLKGFQIQANLNNPSAISLL
ncbi:pyridine nucleotide-disulfide oxidoreductase-like protein [Mycena rebaudengoi]|nr:pyridine nucleotide-disulfide oxidoreductase-like protein [Mycena rebaudengoi]